MQRRQQRGRVSMSLLFGFDAADIKLCLAMFLDGEQLIPLICGHPVCIGMTNRLCTSV